jgi:nucleoside-diphosphate-sugar epimerase
MKTATVTGAGGFIGHHLVKFLKNKGYYVIGVDKKKPEFEETSADEFRLLDLRNANACRKAVTFAARAADEVYHLAADMGGMGFIHTAECEIMHNSALINLNMIHAAWQAKIKKYFFSSSVCIYPDMKVGAPVMTEADAYPANPDNEYGWEKLYTERMIQAYGRNRDMTVRIARFQNCYGPYGTWNGGREKAPAAICRKVAVAEDGDHIDVWGDGTAVRSYTYVDDLVRGIYMLMQSDLEGPTNIGNHEYHTVEELVHLVAKAANKKIKINYIDGPVGVQSRNFSNEKIYKTGWGAKIPLMKGIKTTYDWINQQVAEKKEIFKCQM